MTAETMDVHRAADVSAHDIGIMSGASQTDAKASSPPLFCHECQQNQGPDTFHVMCFACVAIGTT